MVSASWWTVHNPLFFHKFVEIKCLLLQVAILILNVPRGWAWGCSVGGREVRKKEGIQLSFALCQVIQIQEINLGNLCLWNTESGNLLLVESGILGFEFESVIRLQESEIPLRIGIQNPSSTGKESGIHHVESSIQVGFYYLIWGDFLFTDFSIYSIILCHSVLCQPRSCVVIMLYYIIQYNY